MSGELVRVGGPLAMAGLAVVLVARPAPVRLAGLAAWLAGLVLVAVQLAPDGHDVALVGAGLAGLALAAVLAVVLGRWPWALALLVLAAAPARVPVSIGRSEASLLVPLYVVVAAAALLLAWQLVRRPDAGRELGLAAWPLALLAFWLGLSVAWTDDVREAAIQLLFFLGPFGFLCVAVARLPWRARPLAGLFWLLGGMALLFALVGIGQWAARDVFWNPKVVVSNETEPFFRVNSLFWDPSMYGRFLVLALVAALVVLTLGLAARRWPALAAGVAAVWVGLLFSFSQSSFVALVAGVLVLAALAWRGRALAAAALAAAALSSFGFASPAPPLAAAVGSRSELVSEGLGIALDHPLVGVGLGGFKQAYAERLELPQRAPRKAASHTTPVTVAAETGFVGLALFAWLLAAVSWQAFRRPDQGARLTRAALWAAGLAIVCIAVHSLFYDAFFEDPLLWGSVGLVAAAAAARSREAGP